MKTEITFKHFKGTEGINDKFHHETYKLEKFLSSSATIYWTCSKNQKNYLVEVRVVGASFKHFARSSSVNLFKAVEVVTNKLSKQLSKKRKIENNKMHRKHKEKVILDPEQAWTDYDEDYFADVG